MVTPVAGSRGDIFPAHQGIPTALRLAAVMAIFYLVTAGAYILISSSLAGDQAASVEDLKRIEILKGMAFVFVTALVMFGFNYLLLVRIQRHEDQIHQQQQALHQGESAVLAGVIATTIAHDINNALTVAVMSLEEMRPDLVPESRAATLAGDTAQALEEIGSWNQRLFDLGGRRAGREVSMFDLRQCVRQCLDLIRHHPKVRACALTPLLEGPPLPFRGHETILRRALVNLVINAAEAAGSGAKVEVRLHSDQNMATIEVDDNGPGIPADQRDLVMKPFHTTKQDGTGLGLSSVMACAQLHDGGVTIADAPLGGARFILTLRQGRQDSIALEEDP